MNCSEYGPCCSDPRKREKRKLNICPRFHSISLKFVCFEVILQKKLLAINFPEAKVIKHFFGCIVKQVFWFKSSLLLRIKSNTHRNYNFLLKLGIAFLIGNYIQQMKEGDQAWLGLGS
jgi:hypothetical protein